jgi:DNA-binding transcriptional MerR regulator
VRRAVGYALVVRRDALDLDDFAGAAGLHPDLVRRFVALGLLNPDRDTAGRYRFPPAQLVVVARIQRLRSGLSLNYAAIGIVLDLLDRIAELEATVRG